MDLFNSSNKYRIASRLKGTLGPINCLSFAKDGKLLASGADDQALRIWDVQGKRQLQALEDKSGRWGQITCIKWLSVAAAEGNVICFGTGRGLVLVYQGGNGENFRELSNTTVFPFNDSVESIDYDRNKCRLAVSSHNGKLRMYSVDKNGILISLWERAMSAPGIGANCTTPRSIRFTGKGEYIVVFGLESGTMESKIAATGVDSWSKTLNSSIGNAYLSPNETLLMIDNLVDGFDLYKYPHNSPFNSLVISRAKNFVHGGAFFENGTSVACGSDHGQVYLFSVERGEGTQKLKHGTRDSIIQSIDAISTNDWHLIASGTNDNRPDINIYEKMTRTHIVRNTRNWTCSGTTLLTIFNILVVVLFAFHMGLTTDQKGAIISRMLNYQKLGNEQNGVRISYTATGNAESKRESELAMQRAKLLLMERGVDIDDPDWRAQLERSL